MPLRLNKHLNRLVEKAGADLAIRRALFTKLWSLISGPIGILLAAHNLTKEEQGFLYTFASLQGIQIFFELGLTFIIMQFASHEKGGLEWTEDGILAGDPRSEQRLASLLRLAAGWYAAIAVLLSLVLPIAGLWFFSKEPTSLSWRLPWLLVAVSTVLNLLLVPIHGILEGCGRLAQVYGISLIQSVVSTLAFWTALVCGAGLYSPTIQWVASTVIAVTWTLRHYRHFFSHFWRLPIQPENRVSWRREMWPLQWKISLSWASGYFLFQLATPLIFRSIGSAAAGQYGMTLKLVTTAQNISQTWISTKAATYGTYFSRGDWREVRRLFRNSLVMSSLLLAGLSFALISGLLLLPLLGHAKLAERFLSLPLATVMCLNAIIYVPIYAIAVLSRAEKKEPFLWCSIIAAFLTSLAYMTIAPRFGVMGFVCVPLIINAVFVLPWALMVLRELIGRHTIIEIHSNG